jgi:hypothetical protein
VWSGGVASLNKANKAQIAKIADEYFYTDAIQPSDLNLMASVGFFGGKSSWANQFLATDTDPSAVAPQFEFLSAISSV